jgi:hypothetical protein
MNEQTDRQFGGERQMNETDLEIDKQMNEQTD